MDIVFVNKLQIDTVIGVYEWEKSIKQTLVIDLQLATDIRTAAAGDDLAHTIDYAVVCEKVQQLVQAKPLELIETVAENIANLLLTEFPAKAVLVRVGKPSAVKAAATVGVEIRRGQW